MTQKIPCPECAEVNYETSPACWKCGAAMKPKPTPPPEAPEAVEPESHVAPEPPADPAPETVPEPPPPTPQPPETPTEVAEPAPSSIPQPPSPTAPKPAELEAASLTEKEFVTPPVDVEEKPTTPSEWLAYGWAAVVSSPSAFKEALDDYDARRGHKSGGVSSYGCVLTIVVCVCIAVLGLGFISFLARNYQP
jgi:hypothetical protein